jgi:hypothetical protein
MQKVGQIILNFNPLEDKYISREFQSFGIYLAEELGDIKHKALYIKLAKTVHRSLLEKALTYTKDAKVKRKGALFMWKLKQLGAWEGKDKKQKTENSKHKKSKIEDLPF